MTAVEAGPPVRAARFRRAALEGQSSLRRYYGLLVISGPPPDPDLWRDAGDWLSRARRLGSLRYSDLGPRPVPAPEPVDGLAAWLADAADRWWHAARRPDPFTLVVDSADDGRLARRVLELGPECLTCLRYVLVRPGPQRPELAAWLPLEEPVFLFPVTAPADPDEDDESPAAPGVGPLVTWLPAPPSIPGDGAMVAINTVGALPSDRAEYTGDRWVEVRLADVSGRLVEVGSDLEPAAAPRVPDRPQPGRYAVLTGAVEWLRQALSTELGGRVAVVDHWSAVTEPVGAPALPPLALDQLARVRPPEGPVPEPVAGDLSVVTWRLGL